MGVVLVCTIGATGELMRFSKAEVLDGVISSLIATAIIGIVIYAYRKLTEDHL